MRKHIRSLDGLKTLAFALVFVSHIPRLALTNNPYGTAGVSLFFAISGFLAYYTHINNPVGGGVTTNVIFEKSISRSCDHIYICGYIAIILASKVVFGAGILGCD